ncbi:hypothetical protein L2755_06780 [Shewanella abyssi]|uniref:hypothetical protein n=1 Tax=Shewanella abyssi TaxID=311789 RepID=UPI00200C9721|nr:hypothetical protein [Shewanella abyssi]MCL1049291.1 hypothetical protein [Shewanella abyssi]MCL1049330.1 hypothetical protein [Shewanella abyssi]
MSHKYRFILALSLMLLSAGKPAFAEALNLELRPFSKGNYLLAKGRYPQAATHWHKLSAVLLSNPNKVSRQEMWQSAGLAASLAAIAADKAEDPIAYQYWSDSTRYLLTGGTNWSQIQQQLHQRLETANTQLSVAMQVSDVTSAIDENLDIELTALQLWQEKLNFFSFTTPKLGLNRYDANIDYRVDQPTQTYTPSTVQSQQPTSGKKLSGYDANFSHSPSFAPTAQSTAPAKVQLEKEAENKVINASDAALASAAQSQAKESKSTDVNLPTEAPQATNLLGKGGINQAQEIKVESLQKRQIEPISVTEKPKNADKIDPKENDIEPPY